MCVCVLDLLVGISIRTLHSKFIMFLLFSHVITIDSFWIWNFIVYYFFRLKLESWKYETLTQHYCMHHYLLLCFWWDLIM